MTTSMDEEKTSKYPFMKKKKFSKLEVEISQPTRDYK